MTTCLTSPLHACPLPAHYMPYMPITYRARAASREQSLSEKHAQEMATCQADHQRAREEAAAKADEEASHLRAELSHLRAEIERTAAAAAEAAEEARKEREDLDQVSK